MRARRDADWYLHHDPGGFVRYQEGRMDALTIEIHGRQQLRHEATKARLERLGFDTSRFRPLPPLHRSELLDSCWPSDAQIVEHEARSPGRFTRRSVHEVVDERTGRVTRELTEALVRPGIGRVLRIR